MTVRGTSNATILTISKSVQQHTLEHGPGNNEGGAQKPWTGKGEYREADNPASGAGTYFTPSDHHLPYGNTQVTVVV